MSVAQFAAARPSGTVDRAFAHKRSDEDLFINHVARDRDLLAAAGDLPRAHRYFNDSLAPGHDALHLAEFVRQGVEVLAHTLLDVPLTSHFVLRTVRLRIAEPAETPIVGSAVIAFRESQVRRNGSGVAYAVAGPVHCLAAGQEVARLDGLAGFLTPETYRAMRTVSDCGVPAGSVVPNSPESVGRRFPENVLIGQVEGRPREARCLLVPRLHPTFFDRPLDHYPGMMIAEGARQLAIRSYAAAGGTPAEYVRTTSAALEFISFAELDTPPVLQVVSWNSGGGSAEITIESRQGARVTSTCAFRVSSHHQDRSRL